MKPKPTKWFHLRLSCLKKMMMKTMKTVREIASCITFSSVNEKLPPNSLEPKRFAGIIKQYSKKAMPQLMRIMPKMPQFSNLFPKNLYFKCPYQAIVINTLEAMSKAIVQIFFTIDDSLACFLIKKIVPHYDSVTQSFL